MVEPSEELKNKLNQYRAQLSELRSIGTDLCALMRDLSRELLTEGRAPSAEAIGQLAAFRSGFEQVQSAILGSNRNANAGEQSLTSLTDVVDSQAVIQQTLARLDCFANIQHVEQPEFAPLRRCQEDGSRLRQELLAAPVFQARAAAEQFLSPQTPLNAFVTLVADGSELSDERWTTLLDSVSAAYGREVTTAIARGKLVLMSGTRA